MTDFGSSDKLVINEIQFCPGNTNFQVITSENGDREHLAYTIDNGANWTVLNTPTNVIPVPIGGKLYMYTTAAFRSSDKFYVLTRYTIYGDHPGTDDEYRREYFLSEYVILGGTVAYLGSVRTIEDTYSNNWEDLMLLIPTDENNHCYLARGQGVLYKAEIPAIGDIDFYSVSSSSGTKSHTDIRAIAYYKDPLSTESHLLIGHDGGVSSCENKESLVSGSNETIWENINGEGLTITEFLGVASSELQKGLILAGSPDGNGYIFRNEAGINNYYNFSSGDAYKSAVSSTNANLGTYQRNSSGAFDPASTTKIDLLAITDDDDITFPRSAGVDDNEIDNNDLNWAFRPSEFDDEGHFWMGSMNVFEYLDVEGAPTIYEARTKHSEYEDVPELDAKQAITAMKSYDDNTAQIITIYSSVKGMKTEDDPVKFIKSVFNYFDPGDPEFTSQDKTPNFVIDELYPIGASQVNYSFITDIEADPQNFNEVWISFGGTKTSFDQTWLTDGSSGKNGRVYYSPDGGETWYNRSAGLPNFPVQCLEYWQGTDDVLFAGTDVGVFIWEKDPESETGEGSWKCFKENMPYVAVSNLDINYCSSTLYASTFGYGIWQTMLPSIDLIISGDVLWDRQTTISSNIIIEPGSTLTINDCKVRMPADGKIIVKNGGALILDGATITSTCAFWQGIEVWGLGNDTPHPVFGDVYSGAYPASAGDHGIVYLKNGATLENALLAVCTYNSSMPEEGDYYGGIIIAYDAIFLNNYRCVEFKPYDYGLPNATDDNISAFKNCTFLRDVNVTTDLLDEPIDIHLISVDGISIIGCDFLNNNLSNKPTAIESINSSFTLQSELCLLDPPGCLLDISTVSRYYYGISTSNTSYYPLETHIEGIEFINNERAIYLSVNFNTNIWRNNFMVPDLTYDTGYGLYLEGSSGYHVEGNTFSRYTSITNDAHYCSGIIIENNHNIATEIYRNTFEDIEIGIRSQGNNSKLQIKCNDFIAPIPKHNIVVTSGVIGNQGICNNTTKLPAGNTFSAGGSGTNHFRIVPAVIDPVFYRHHSEFIYTPQYYSTSKIILHDCEVSGEGYCISTLPGDGTGVEERLSEIENVNYDSLISLEMARLDGGSTEQLLADIQEVNAGTLLDLLSAYSPYISDSVLKVLSVEDILNETTLLDILQLNQPISDSVAEILNSYSPELPDPVIEDLNNNIIDDTIIHSAVQEVSANVLVLEVLRDQAFEDILLDKITENEIAGALDLLNQVTEPWAIQRKAELLSATGDFSGSSIQIDSLSTYPEFANFNALYNIINNLGANGNQFYEIDGAAVSTLLAFQSKESIEGISAQNLLKVADTAFTYPEIIDPIPDEALRYSSVYIQGSTNLNIYPVPTDAILYVELSGEVEVNSVLELINLNGLTMASQIVQTDTFSAICWFNVGEFAPGIYLLNLYDASGKKLASGKAIIQH